jgi:hypothetical protein
MTCNTSAVAVCCSSASPRSRLRISNSPNSRTFSMAIAAWSAKVDLGGGEGPNLAPPASDDPGRPTLPKNRYPEK